MVGPSELRDIRRLAVYQDRINAVDWSGPSSPATAWAYSGDVLKTVSVASDEGPDSQGVWHMPGDPIVDTYRYEESEHEPALTPTGSSTIVGSPQSRAVGSLPDALTMGFSGDVNVSEGVVEKPGTVRLAMADGRPIPFGWAQAVRQAAIENKASDPDGTRIAVIQAAIDAPSEPTVWFLENNGYDLHAVVWHRAAEGGYDRVARTHLQYQDAGDEPLLQTISRTEPTPIDVSQRMDTARMAWESRLIVDRYQLQRAQDAGNPAGLRTRIGYQQQGLLFPGEQARLIVAGTGKPADQWRDKVATAAALLLAQQPEHTIKKKGHTIMSDSMNSGEQLLATLKTDPGSKAGWNAEQLDAALTAASTEVNELGDRMEELAYEIRQAERGEGGTVEDAQQRFYTVQDEHRAARDRQWDIQQELFKRTGANPSRTQNGSAGATGRTRGQAKSWAKVNVPNKLVHVFQQHGKDGKTWQKISVRIPSGTTINGVPLDGFNLDQFASKRVLEAKANGRDVTVAFPPDKPIELWKGKGANRETFRIDNPWDLCKAVKASREAFLNAAKIRGLAAKGRLEPVSPAGEPTHGARELALCLNNDADLYPQIQRTAERLARYYVDGQYDPDKAVKAFRHIADQEAIQYERQFGNKDAQRIGDVTSFTMADRTMAAALVLAENTELINEQIDSLADQGIGDPEIINANLNLRNLANPPEQRQIPPETDMDALGLVEKWGESYDSVSRNSSSWEVTNQILEYSGLDPAEHEGLGNAVHELVEPVFDELDGDMPGGSQQFAQAVMEHEAERMNPDLTPMQQLPEGVGQDPWPSAEPTRPPQDQNPAQPASGVSEPRPAKGTDVAKESRQPPSTSMKSFREAMAERAKTLMESSRAQPAQPVRGPQHDAR
ncbi:hypothetical protein [Bifidobacterium miconisargentati]|uniref:hypothetical protein n=1 Tax=Bifidobacterium miconisargentati TaxID=2834437 RepID=UPI001BDCAC12|nr:hypothetical protein [Bifidobacterium miconisargentati]MBW3089208.1 hypothetical protein [Bifidobacterium miconisargentati]